MSSSAPKSKFQKMEVETIHRSQIKNADYNPRVITEAAKKQLRKMLSKHGLVTTLVWNKRSGNLVGGHQRIDALDTLEKSQNYSLIVSVIDVDENEEKILNVQLNNPSMQGEWDFDKLTEMVESSGINPADMGFSEGDIGVIFGDSEGFAELVGDTEDVSEAKESLRKIKEHRAESLEKMKEGQSADFYFTVVCRDADQKRSLLRALNTPDYESFVSGEELAKAVNSGN